MIENSRKLNYKPRSFISLLLCTLILGGCSTTSEYDWGMYGTPTPALAFYATQMKHAHEICTDKSDREASDRFHKFGVERGIWTSDYREKSPSFAKNEADISAQRSALWENMSEEQKRNFCSGYLADVEWSKGKSVFYLVDRAVQTRKTFSPVSKERLQHAQNAQIVSGAMSLVLIASSIGQARQNDFASGQQLNNQARPFTAQVGKPIESGNSLCKAYGPFIEVNALKLEGKLEKYHSVTSCF